MEAFVRENHAQEGGHDATHVLTVTDYAIRIADEIDEPVEPFILIAGALFHDLGRIGYETGELHGLRGAMLGGQFLESVDVPPEEREAILRIIARHTATTGVPPETIEERVVFDADALDRLGVMGMLRGLMGKRGSTQFIIEDRIRKRMGDYDRLHFVVSRRIGEALHRDTVDVVERFRRALSEEARRLAQIRWPVPDGQRVEVPTVREAAEDESSEALAGGMVRLEPEETRKAEGRPAMYGFSRGLAEREIILVEQVARFAEENHRNQRAHDYAHVLTVVDYALRIARHAPEPVDPLVTICGAFLHDIGRVGERGAGAMHGLRGGAIVAEYFASTWVPHDVRRRIQEVVVRHSLTSGLSPRTLEEKIVWDADGLAGLGLLGALRGIISGVGSSEEIVEACLRYAGKQHDRLHFEPSRLLAAKLESAAEDMIGRFRETLERRIERVARLSLPEGAGAPRRRAAS